MAPRAGGRQESAPAEAPHLAKIIYSKAAFRDLARLDVFLESIDADLADVSDLIIGAISLLAEHPLIGRPIDTRLRELVISHGKTGYVALYGYVPSRDRVTIARIRHQRELRSRRAAKQ